ncbi:YbdD/YjiX family protein [Georgenia sp. SYP-B2076]|uniref:YbdD/YjiX family protein n=1 Tax=Georgenia sp. SYP-B2076 TaxID=2495881 RepID=UPI00197AD005|nr:YbdD/YjiX family protein [Georgenia sp. SYP-B2076]
MADGARGGRDVLVRASSAAGRALGAVRWYITTVMGDHDYARFVAHQQRVHPGAPVPTEKEFWRRRWAEQDANPGARCC